MMHGIMNLKFQAWCRMFSVIPSAVHG